MTTRAVVVGAGGLGGPIAIALGGADIEVAIVDPDVVELSNLHRQIQFTAADLGHRKATRLAGLVVGRGGRARAVVDRFTSANADRIAEDADLIVDGSDDPATKFAVSDWAVANGRHYVIAAALRYGGNVMIGAPGVACYRCLFEEPQLDAPTCAEAGVLGPVVGAIGGVAAGVAISLVRGERGLAGALLSFDDLRAVADPRVVRFAARRGCPACAKAPISPFDAPVRIASGDA